MTTQRLQNRNVTTSTAGRRIAWDRMGTMLADYNGVDSGIRYYGTNGHRDSAWIGDGTGAVTATVRYDPWGGIIASSGTTPDWRFQGSWTDTSTDLQWVITRWYAPTLGRFISEDTLLGRPTNPLSRHLYAYAEGDPVGGWDPDGRQVAEARQYCQVLAWSPGYQKTCEGIAPAFVLIAAGLVGLGYALIRSRIEAGTVPYPNPWRAPGAKCFVIGEDQARVNEFAREEERCITMWTLSFTLRNLPRRVKLAMNFAWVAVQRINRRHLYDLGPCNKHSWWPSSDYYKLEQLATLFHRPRTNLWWWACKEGEKYYKLAM